MFRIKHLKKYILWCLKRTIAYSKNSLTSHKFTISMLVNWRGCWTDVFFTDISTTLTLCVNLITVSQRTLVCNIFHMVHEFTFTGKMNLKSAHEFNTDMLSYDMHKHVIYYLYRYIWHRKLCRQTFL